MKKYQIKKAGVDFNFISEELFIRGSRKKYVSVTNNNERAMFKYEREDYLCSEACSEKIAYEIAKCLGYNCAKIDLAEDYDGKLGVLNYYFFNSNYSSHTDIIAYLNSRKKSRNYYYTISNIKNALDKMDLKFFNYFLKIMVFDALIGEQDRHEENWGLIVKDKKRCLSPLYDNGDSLLREFKNEKILNKYYNGVKDFNSYIYRSKTIIYKEDNKTQFKHFELIKYLLEKYPNNMVKELNNLNKLSDVIVNRIVNKIPDNLLTIKHKKYIILYIKKRRDILLDML